MPIAFCFSEFSLSFSPAALHCFSAHVSVFLSFHFYCIEFVYLYLLTCEFTAAFHTTLLFRVRERARSWWINWNSTLQIDIFPITFYLISSFTFIVWIWNRALVFACKKNAFLFFHSFVEFVQARWLDNVHGICVYIFFVTCNNAIVQIVYNS